MVISHSQARRIGIASICAVILLQAFNSFTCYHHDLIDFLLATAIFVGFPLLPAFASLALRNPLRAVGACALFAPWLLLAYYTDCVPPYPRDASMIYVAVLMFGTVTSFIGALITDPLTKRMGIEISER